MSGFRIFRCFLSRSVSFLPCPAMRRAACPVICLFLCLAAGLAPQSASAQTADPNAAAPAPGQESVAPPALDFLIVLPGAPESSEESVRAVDALAAFIAERTGRSVQGGFSNDPEAAAARLEQQPPRWGVVSLGFYLQYAARLKMTPVAATMPGGAGRDVWRVLTAPDYAGEKLAGEFRGSMLFDRAASACLLLRGRSGGIVGFRGERSPLMALRDLGRKDLAGVVLDGLQYEAAAHLPYQVQFKVLYEVRDLPADPVVWFGEGAQGADAGLLLKALQAAAKAPQARPGLALLRSADFGPADKGLAALLRECGP